MGPTSKARRGTTSKDARAVMAPVVTVCALIVLLVAILYLIGQTSSSDLVWTRTVYALTPIVTIAFAAAGWLFGREVHRQEVVNAQAQAEQAQDERDQAQNERDEERSRGILLASAVIGRSQATASVAEATGSASERASRGSAATMTGLSDLSDLAARLYPELASGRHA